MARPRHLDLGDGVLHLPEVTRPHLAQEFRDKGKEEDSENLCLKLMSQARMRARGEVSAYFKLKGVK